MSDRRGTITPRKDTAPDGRDRRIAEMEAESEQVRAENVALKAGIAELERRLAELERAGKRQATPLARDEHKADPKRPGRKAGQGLFSYRAKPTPDEVDETKEVRLDRCPDCGGAVADIREHEQFVIDLPEIEPQITRYVTESGYCRRCGCRVRSRHPEQISTAAGAAGVMIGPRAKALLLPFKLNAQGDIDAASPVKVLILGGIDGTTGLITNTAEVFTDNATTGTWAATPNPMTYSRMHVNGVLLADGQAWSSAEKMHPVWRPFRRVVNPVRLPVGTRYWDQSSTIPMRRVIPGHCCRQWNDRGSTTRPPVF